MRSIFPQVSPVVLAAVDDLLFSSRIRTVARQLGVTVSFARSPEAVLQASRETTPALVILDLNGERMRPLDVLAALKGDAALSSVRTVGFASHVDTATITAARRAGCDEVMARSAFVASLPEILAGAK